ncbi:MAG TPA: aspartate-alanine antiporter [Chthoniobacterales bacterium]|nr:aspartate-alanine antiporter [Chthoniobacterales bacterium]
MRFILDSLRLHPELAIYLTVSLGFLIGRIKIAGFTLGSVTGVLITALLIGQLDIPVSPGLKSVFFLLFLFAVGYGVGPEFVRGLRKDGVPQAVFAVFVCLLCLATAVVVAKLFHFDAGYGAGVFGGACTVSAVLGVGADAINQLPLGSELKQRSINEMSIAFAVTYIFGTAGVAWFLAALGPKILGVDLADACRKLESQLGGDEPDPSVHTAYHLMDVRAYRITAPGFQEQTVREFESKFPSQRLFLERLRRGHKILECNPDTKIQPGDILAIASRTETLIEDSSLFGVEVSDPELLDYPDETLDVMVTQGELVGVTLGAFAELGTDQRSRGVFVRELSRGGHPLPFNSGVKIAKGDVLRISGNRRDVERIAKNIGYPLRSSYVSDLVLVGIGIFLGAFFGLLGVSVNGIPINLSTSGGTLVAGLVFGWLRSVHPSFGNIPSAGLWVFNNLGLTVFVAVVGLEAGPLFIKGLEEAGLMLLVAGAIVTILPMYLALLLGKYVFKMHPGVLLGACAGARATTAALASVQDAAQSRVPALGFSVCFAVGNTLLTVWGVVIVLLLR